MLYCYLNIYLGNKDNDFYFERENKERKDVSDSDQLRKCDFKIFAHWDHADVK